MSLTTFLEGTDTGPMFLCNGGALSHFMKESFLLNRKTLYTRLQVR